MVAQGIYFRQGEHAIHFDGTINLGNILTAVTFLFLAGLAWRDLRWRVANLETWRKENIEMWKAHLQDARGRDAIINRLDKNFEVLQAIIMQKRDDR